MTKNVLPVCWCALSGKVLTQIRIEFDFANNAIIVHVGAKSKRYKVKENDEFVYCFQKTQVKCHDGIEGFYEYVMKHERDGTFSNMLVTAAEKALSI